MSVQIRIIKTQLTGFRTKMNGIPVIWSNAQFLNKRSDSFEINFKIYIFPLIQFIIRFLDLLEIQSKNVHILTMSHFTFEIHSKQNRKPIKSNHVRNKRLLPKIEIIHKNDGFSKVSNTADFRSRTKEEKKTIR